VSAADTPPAEGIRITGRLHVPLRTTLQHGPSDARIETVAPVSSGGEGDRFSPIDLFAASVASCGATAMNLCAQKHGIDLRGVAFSVTSFTSDDPRQVARLVIEHIIDVVCDEEAFAMLVHAAEGCPIRRSIHPGIVVEESFRRAR
jgi:uncharacterized OsmC-like protein